MKNKKIIDALDSILPNDDVKNRILRVKFYLLLMILIVIFMALKFMKVKIKIL